MSAEVESMMFTGRERPWHGLGTQVEEAPDSREALIAAGLDWDVVQRPVFTQDGVKVTGYFANVRQQDGSILGVVCNNTLNLALNTADRCWSIHHTGDIAAKLEDARETLFMAEDYMNELGKGFEDLSRKRLTDAAVEEYIQELLPVADDASETTEKNILRLRKGEIEAFNIYKKNGKDQHSPNFYCRELYERHQRGLALSVLAQDIKEKYQMMQEKVSIGLIGDVIRFEEVKNKIIFTVISGEKNKELAMQITALRMIFDFLKSFPN